ncbi:MAG: hypothetical protein IJO16_00545 [Clostridia bacterium]|nr:hypothetical protein [Clostridia bacterium]
MGFGLILAFISAIELVGGTAMKLFGFEYIAIKDIIIFFIVSTLISYPVGLLVSALPKYLLHKENIQLKYAKGLYVFLDTFATAGGMFVTDNIMEGISASGLSVILISFIFAVLSMDKIKKPLE